MVDRHAWLPCRHPGPRAWAVLALALALVAVGASCRQPLPPLPACAPSPVVVPTILHLIPAQEDLDPSTDLHYTGSVQVIDPDAYRLEVIGLVDRPLNLTYDQLRCLPRHDVYCRLICPGYFEDEATWAGARFGDVLDLAGVQAAATELRLFSQDRYKAVVPLTAGRAEDSLLAYEWESEPLPVLHGFPVRAVFPDLDGNTWVKWLIKIQVR